VGEKASRLDHIADVPAEPVSVHRGDVVPVDDDVAFGRLDEPVDHLEGGGFAAAGRADEHDGLAGRNLQREMVDCGILTAVGFRHVLQKNRSAGDVGFLVPENVFFNLLVLRHEYLAT
jgi:hypothetical protein